MTNAERLVDLLSAAERAVSHVRQLVRAPSTGDEVFDLHRMAGICHACGAMFDTAFAVGCQVFQWFWAVSTHEEPKNEALRLRAIALADQVMAAWAEMKTAHQSEAK